MIRFTGQRIEISEIIIHQEPAGQKAANAIFISSNMHICWRSLELQLYFVLIQLNLRFLETKSGSRVDADISTLQTSARDFSFSLYRLFAGRVFHRSVFRPFKSFNWSVFVSSQPHNRPLHQDQLQRVRCVPLEKVLYSFFYQVKQRVWPLIYVSLLLKVVHSRLDACLDQKWTQHLRPECHQAKQEPVHDGIHGSTSHLNSRLRNCKKKHDSLWDCMAQGGTFEF